MSNEAPATTNAVSLKLPDFWPSDPELWFAQAEALFEAQKITRQQTKFGHVVRVLPAQYASEVRDIILHPPEASYTAIREALQKRVGASKRQQLQQLLHVEALGDRRPSQLLRYMLKLRGGTAEESDNDALFRELFLQKLPLNVRTALANSQRDQPTPSSRDHRHHGRSPRPIGTGLRDPAARKSRDCRDPHRTAEDLESAQVAARARPAPEICWYHERFGSKATKCRAPCKFPQHSGNSRASR